MTWIYYILILSLICCYLWWVHSHRYDRLREILALNPKKDCFRIVFLAGYLEGPFLAKAAAEIALIRTFGVPSISKLLHQTGHFRNHLSKRFEDTDLLIRELSEHPLQSERSKTAIARLNFIHGNYPSITNEEYLFVLSTFLFVAVDWAKKWGWREITEVEKQGAFYFWRKIGKRMGIKDIPRTFISFEDWKNKYETEHFIYSETNSKVTMETLKLVTEKFPKFCEPAIVHVVSSLLDQKLRTALGFDPVSPALVSFVSGVLKLRALFIRYCCPPRLAHFAAIRTSREKNSEGKYKTLWKSFGIENYPSGYHIEEIGPYQPGETKNLYEKKTNETKKEK